MTIDLTKFTKGKNFLSTDFNFDDTVDKISVKTDATSNVGIAIAAAVEASCGCIPVLSTDLGGIVPTTPEPYVWIDDSAGHPGVLMQWFDADGGGDDAFHPAGYGSTEPTVPTFAFDNATTTPAMTGTTSTLLAAHTGMKRCVLKDDGTVNYYLSSTDSTKKADGTAANLTGADGMVMVEIPKFYVKHTTNGTSQEWWLSDTPATGYAVHPAFVRDGSEVNYRYYSAYDTAVLDASSGSVISGFDNNDNRGRIDFAADKLVSVSGAFPMVGLTRANFRQLAKNRGNGWSLGDFWLVQAIQMLYLAEHQTFDSQSILGAGNSASNYNSANTSNQANSPHSVAGKSNVLGNGSTNASTGAGSASYQVAFMSYRGIENFFGNCWNWTDGMNANDNMLYVCNNSASFADDTTSGYSLLTTLPNSHGWQATVQSLDFAILPATVGASSTTGLTDHYWQNPGWRVSLFGGEALYGAHDGVFCWALHVVSGLLDRSVGARLAR